ncbi:heterokaryon incompatibility protein-domain-containing protein [Xylaria scruposa]|nr:heterokaryon incompatibility protein-domain-containing protein [Xylaria scruposa]
MDDLPIDTTRRDLSENTLSDNNIRGSAESGRLSHEHPSVATNLSPVDSGGNESAEVVHNNAQMSQNIISMGSILQQLGQATTSATGDANESAPTARFADEAVASDDLFLSRGSLSRPGQATIRATGNANEEPSLTGAGIEVHEPTDPDPDFENRNLPQPSQPSQATPSATGDSNATRSSDERAVDGFNPFLNDIAGSPRLPKRRRKSNGGARRPRPPKLVLGANQTSTKRRLAARPLPVFGGYRVPVATTVGDTEIIEWVSTNAAGTPLSPNAPRAQTRTAEGVPLDSAHPPVFPIAGQPMSARGATTDFGRTSVTPTPGQLGTAALGRSEGLEASPLRMIALQAGAQLQSKNVDQASELGRSEGLEASPLRMIALQAGAQLQSKNVDQASELGRVLQENFDASASNSNRRIPPWRFEAPHIQRAQQVNDILNWRSTADMKRMNVTKGHSTLFVEDHSKDPIVTPSVDRKAHLEEFKFRLRIHSGRKPLETIRLLKPVWSPALLKKRDIIDTDEIPKYDLRDFPCEDRPKYMALSYVWCGDTPTKAISINGIVLQVRKSLAQALQSIAHFDPHTYVFADAICINQQDDREKSIMVQHMAQIFSDAWLVYAWLGPVQEYSTQTLMKHFSELGKLFWQHVGPTESHKLGERSLDIDTILTRNISHLYGRFKYPLVKQGIFPTKAYSSFSARPFWSRIWVLQEVYLAKRLYYACGSCYLESNYLAGALILLEAFQRHLIRTQALTSELSIPLKEFAVEFPSFPEMHRLIVYTSIYPMDVVSLRIAMTNFCVKELPGGSKATDSRDMVYGLLGFCNEEERSYIQADYSKSVQSVYTSVTRAMIRNGFTDIMSWAQIDAKRIADLPSWVPDYSSTIYESLCSQGQAKPWLPQFRACNEARYNHDEAMHPIDPLAIPVHGRQLDRVTQIGRRWFPRSRAGSAQLSTDQAEALIAHSVSYEDLCFFLDQVREFVRLAEMRYNSDRFPVNRALRPTGPGGYGEGAPFSHAGIWRVPCCDQIVINSRLVRGDPTTESRYNAMIRYLEACKDEPKNELPAESRPYLESLLRWADKRPFFTEHGFVGLGPANMEPGDTLAVLDGFNACYLVRPQRLPSSEYRLVGEAYVDGIMGGEMIGSIPDPRVWFHLV